MTVDLRNSEIYRLHFEERASLSELARRFQMSVSAICKICQVERAHHPDAPRPAPKTGSPGPALGEPVSRRHRMIGQKLRWWRDIQNHMGVREAAVRLGISVHRLRVIEEGCYADLSVQLVQRLAELIDIDVDEFLSENVKPPHEWTRYKG